MSHMNISASLPSAAPWRNLSWTLFLPLVFAGNIVMATLAWIIVEAIIRTLCYDSAGFRGLIV